MSDKIKKVLSVPFKVLMSYGVDKWKQTTIQYFKQFYHENKNNPYFNLYATKQDFIVIKLFNREILNNDEIEFILNIIQENNVIQTLRNIENYLRQKNISHDVMPLNLSTPASPFKLDDFPEQYKSLTYENTIKSISRNFDIVKKKVDKEQYTYIIYLKADYFLINQDMQFVDIDKNKHLVFE